MMDDRPFRYQIPVACIVVVVVVVVVAVVVCIVAVACWDFAKAACNRMAPLEVCGGASKV